MQCIFFMLPGNALLLGEMGIGNTSAASVPIALAEAVNEGRVQVGAVFGASLLGTPRDYLFYSGGGGTVRGQPYQSLGVNVLRAITDDYRTGGSFFLGTSVEARVKVSRKMGLVGFFDMGRIGLDNFTDDIGGWHSGAGLGLRYDTPVGPIRLDVATPVGGTTGDGVQVYVGLGQAF